jgi:Nucleotidyl transferase AbiEii toxin, Type IV TA system
VMNAAFRGVIAAGDDARRDLFLTTAGRLGTAVQNVEKDFWVCWTLDALFNGLAAGTPRLLFKGGTSLSKSFGLIDRFSEDIDITVYRNDLGEAASVEELEALSGKKRRARLDDIKGTCQAFIAGPLLTDIAELAADAMTAAQIGGERYRVELDAADADQQTLLFWYPSATTAEGGYIQAAVKIEWGAKSALDPHTTTTVKPYAGDDFPGGDLTIGGITTVDPTRTFWDKVVILHGLRRWFDHRDQLRHGGQRVSRHYYDVFRLLRSETGRAAEADRQLAEDCARHARMFFNTPNFDLDQAAQGTWSIVPTTPMMDALERDYNAMAGMIMGPTPTFTAVVDAVASLETRLNAAP